MTYTYECNKCGVIEIERTIKDKEITKCPNCNSDIKRIYKPAGVIWNCSGACGKVG